MCGQGLAGFALLLGSRPDFPGHIPQVPVVHDVEDACKLGAVGVVIVDIVIDGDETHTHPTKVYFSIKPRFNIVTTDSAHVLDQHRLDNASFNVCQQLLPTRTVKVAAAVTIISIVTTIGEAPFLSVCLQQTLLRRDLSRVFSAQKTEQGYDYAA